MAYTKTTWQNNVTDIDANNLNKIEQGIYDNSLVVDAVTDKLNPTDTETYKTAELTEGQITDVIGVSDIVIKGQTEQDGTPTPSAPVDVNVVSGSNVVNTNNKNFFDKNTVVQGDWNNPRLSTALVSYIGKISTGDKYTVSNYNSRRFALIISSMPTPNNQASALQSSGNQTATQSTFTATASGYLMFKITKTDGSNITPNEINSNDFQIEKGSTATTYEPHQGKELPLDLGTIELCKIGDYQDYFYKSGSKWYLHKEMKRIKLDGSENWSTRSAGVGQLYETTVSGFFSTTGLSLGLSNQYVSNINLTENNTFRIIYGNTLAIHNDTVSGLDNFKNALSLSNLIIYYPLATATDTEITDTTLISQLEAIYNAPLYEQTNITQTNNDLPMILDITACKDNINGIKAFIRK